jgi:transposase
MDAEQLKQDVRDGRICPERLVDMVTAQQRQLAIAYRRIEELEKQIGGGRTPKLDQPYSMRAEEKRQAARGKKRKKKRKPLRRGRLSTAHKLALAEREENVFPEGLDPQQCKLSHSRPVWRLENGRAVLIAYHIFRGGRNQYGKIPGALGRSEWGIEIVIAIAYQVYILGLSFDKVCAVMSFFQGLKLTKSQTDALLHRLARQWENEFETLCTLLANSAVVHADETSWSINSVWAFLSEQVRVLLFGVHKDGATLQAILDPATFAGVMVSDDAAVYANFSKAQKCWAHLIRKAIKLTLQDPDNAEYRSFADALLSLYRKACRIKRDGRLGQAGRERKVAELDDELLALCAARWLDETPTPGETENAYRCLTHELMRLMLAQELFTFVLHAEVDGTNNEAERELRSPAQARKTCRTNKTLRGARRQSILHSVLESLRKQLCEFTLGTVVAEVLRWSAVGRSCFAELAQKLGLGPGESSVLDAVLPMPP